MKQWNNYSGADFTFVICAYKECAYLEECIISLRNQTVKTNILISTSTPNSYIKNLADKYGIEVRINLHGGQVSDYNFAFNQAETALVMLAHQDELLAPRFAERVLAELNLSYRPIIAFTNYIEMHNDIPDKKASVMVRIKRFLLLPLMFRNAGKTVFVKRLIQRFGDPITHPSVVCVKQEFPSIVFREKYKASMDWDLWERLSRQEGSFVYIKEILLYHRMNDDNQTALLLKTSNARFEDEYEILCRFWPRCIARIIMKFYKKSANFY